MTYQGRLYAKAQMLRRQLRNAYDRLPGDYDVLLTPTTQMKAHRRHETQSEAEMVLAKWNMVVNTAPIHMTGIQHFRFRAASPAVCGSE